MVIIAECVRVSLVSPTFCNLFTLIFKKNYVSCISVHVSIILKSAFSLPQVPWIKSVVVQFGSECFYLLSHLADLENVSSQY